MGSYTAGRRPRGGSGVKVVAWSWPSEVGFLVDWGADSPGSCALGALLEKDNKPAGSRSSVGNDAAAVPLVSVPIAAV